MLYNNIVRMIARDKKRPLLYAKNGMEIEMTEFDPKTKYQKGRESQYCQYYKLQERESQKAAQNGQPKLNDLPMPFNPKIVKMNGVTFRLIEKRGGQERPRQSKIPTMLVACYMCRNVQTVPGSANTFRCGTCSSINECLPTLAFLMCYNCQSKVLYPTGVSDFIKCTKCTAVNQLPKSVKYKQQVEIEEPCYYVNMDKQSTGGVNPYEGINKEWDLEDLLSQEQMATLHYPQL